MSYKSRLWWLLLEGRQMDSDRYLRFWSDFCNVFDDIDKADLKCIMVLLKIDRDTRNKVKSPEEFVDVLKEKDFAREGSCDNLITLLRENDYSRLADELQYCVDDFLKDKMHSKGPNLDFCEDHRANKEAVCLTCFARICFACAFYSHSEHEVVAMEKLDDKIQGALAALRIEITCLEGELELFLAHISTQQKAINETVDFGLQTLTRSFQDQFYHQTRNLDTLREANALCDEEELEHHKTLFGEIETSMHFCNEAANTVLHESKFSRLQNLNELERKIDIDENNLDKCRKYFLDSLSKSQYRPVAISATVATLAHGQVLGAVKVTNLQMIMVRNYQDYKNYIHIACLSCKKPEVLFWEQTFEITKNPPLIVMAKTLIVLPQRLMILVGFGRKILTITVHIDQKIHQLFLRSSEIIDLNLPSSAHVTGISAIVGELSHKGIITTDSKSGKFHIFDKDFHLSETIECTEIYQGVTCSQKNEVYKIASTSDLSSVSLFRTSVQSKELRCIYKIEDNYPFGDMFVQSMIFDGSFISVLWVSKVENSDDNIQWRVVVYDDDDGDEKHVSAEGECTADIKPISLSHVKNEALLCFSDGSVKEFCTVDLGDLGGLDLPGVELALGSVLESLQQNLGDPFERFARMLTAAIEFEQ